MLYDLDITIESAEARETVRRIVSALPDGVIGAVYNEGADQGNGRYDHWVQSGETQAEVHQGRWQTDQSVADDRQPQFQVAMETATQKLADGDMAGFWREAEQMLDETQQEVQRYPPPPANSRYVRTETLLRGWRNRSARSGAVQL